MKALLPLLFSGLVSAQQCVEPGVGAPPLPFFDPFGVLTQEKEDEEEEYFEKIGDGWTAGSNKGGVRIGTWWHYQDKDNWKKVTYRGGEVVFWQKLCGGRRLFEITYVNDIMSVNWGETLIKIYELKWNKDRTLDWQQVDAIRNYLSLNMHGHFNNVDGTPSASRSNFGYKYKWGDTFERSIMGITQK